MKEFATWGELAIAISELTEEQRRQPVQCLNPTPEENDIQVIEAGIVNRNSGSPNCSTPTVPAPGCPSSLKSGCTCAVLDNHHGRGFLMNGEVCFWISGDCPLHGVKHRSV